MADFVFPPALQPSVAVAGEEARFPVRRIFCVGRNYAAHAREMGHEPDREPPFFFTKPADAVVDTDTVIPYPSLTKDLHHEIEMVVAIGKGGSDIDPAHALDHVYGYAVGLDLTRRDLQGEAKKKGRPWDWGKAFDRSSPCGPIVPVAETGHPSEGRVWLAVNGEIRQEGDLDELIWPVADVIALCSQAMELKAGDLIYTGTPAGVGALQPGDQVEGGVDGIGEIAITIGEA
ncbi:MAG: fumarylacetoacetate hydrolase family protein [Nitratireductor rhodophyticola]|uniref:fumarylacetoacetate hydrolase family protein n=1 Tax=Nitratireductor rhodophyticola TaxID=2854036 RepID=UPI0032D8E591